MFTLAFSFKGKEGMVELMVVGTEWCKNSSHYGEAGSCEQPDPKTGSNYLEPALSYPLLSDMPTS